MGILHSKSRFFGCKTEEEEEEAAAAFNYLQQNDSVGLPRRLWSLIYKSFGWVLGLVWRRKRGKPPLLPVQNTEAAKPLLVEENSNEWRGSESVDVLSCPEETKQRERDVDVVLPISGQASYKEVIPHVDSVRIDAPTNVAPAMEKKKKKRKKKKKQQQADPQEKEEEEVTSSSSAVFVSSKDAPTSNAVVSIKTTSSSQVQTDDERYKSVDVLSYVQQWRLKNNQKFTCPSATSSTNAAAAVVLEEEGMMKGMHKKADPEQEKEGLMSCCKGKTPLSTVPVQKDASPALEKKKQQADPQEKKKSSSSASAVSVTRKDSPTSNAAVPMKITSSSQDQTDDERCKSSVDVLPYQQWQWRLKNNQIFTYPSATSSTNILKKDAAEGIMKGMHKKAAPEQGKEGLMSCCKGKTPLSTVSVQKDAAPALEKKKQQQADPQEKKKSSSSASAVSVTRKDAPASNAVSSIKITSSSQVQTDDERCKSSVDVLSYQQWRLKKKALVLEEMMRIKKADAEEEKKKKKKVKVKLSRFIHENKSGMKKKKAEEDHHVVVSKERWIKHYSSSHRILLVGEGDFSFSASLALAFSSAGASNIIATSLNPQAFLINNYSRAASNIEVLKKRHSKVIHEVDATKMSTHPSLQHLQFDRIIFNFPYAGLAELKGLPRQSKLRCHRRLVSKFLMNAKEMISEDGEIHISHKTNAFHAEFKLESIASTHKLRLIEAVDFKHLDYPGYNTKCGFGGDENFCCYPSKTYKFGLKNVS